MAETKKDERLLRIFARLQKRNEQRHLYSIRTAFIATIFDLCRRLGVGTVIEYVDNGEQPARLRSAGMFLIQGYPFSPPVTGQEVADCAKKMEEVKSDGKDALCVREMRE